MSVVGSLPIADIDKYFGILDSCYQNDSILTAIKPLNISGISDLNISGMANTQIDSLNISKALDFDIE
jgi:hypothetical protein